MGNIPIIIKINAVLRAIYDLYFGMVSINIYIKINRITASNCVFIIITSINFILKYFK